MAINYNDPYNQGIGNIDLGNMNLGQVPVDNMQLAKNLNVGALKNIEEYQKTFVPREPTGGFFDSIYEAQYNKIPKGISKYDFLKGINEGTFEMGGAGVFKENVGGLFPKGTFKGDFNTWGDADINLKQIPGSFRYNIDVDTENIKGKVLEDLEKKGWFSTDDQASLDDDEYDFSGIEGQTALLGLPQLFGMLKGGFSKKAAINYAKRRAALSAANLALSTGSAIAGQKNKPSAAQQVQQNIQTYGNRDRPNEGMNVPGGGRGQSPTGGDVAGTPFVRGGRASYFDGGLLSLWPR